MGRMRVFWNETNDQPPASLTATRVWIESRLRSRLHLPRITVPPSVCTIATSGLTKLTSVRSKISRVPVYPAIEDLLMRRGDLPAAAHHRSVVADEKGVVAERRSERLPVARAQRVEHLSVHSADRALVCGPLLVGSGVAVHGSELPSCEWAVRLRGFEEDPGDLVRCLQ
jgi:hypothetical protein